MKLKNLLLLGLGLAACISGCKKQRESRGNANAGQAARQENTVVQKKAALDNIVKDECNITDVQHSSVTFGLTSNFAVNHEFVYIACSNPEKTLTLVYPHARMIRRGIVDVKFRPVEGGSIGSEHFVKKFVNITDVDLENRQGGVKIYFDQFQIYADGIILEDGINYK